MSFGRLRVTLLAATALTALPALANPLGPQVAAGTVQIDGLGTDALSVQQSTDKAIVNWNTFDVGLGETTTIAQPGVDSVLLNRVTGGLGASQIPGTLSANGQVFLINPDGVLFGKDATVDVGALVATTHGLLDGDFLSGNYAFGLSGSADASIVNLGTISVADGGFAALVAPGVRNDGIISANLGKVALASGNSFSLDLFGDGLIKLAVDDEIAGQVIDLETGLPLNSLVVNNGLLSADGGTVQLTAAAAREVLDSVINNTGVIEANSIGTRNGKIVLSAQTAKTKPAAAAAQKVRVSGHLLSIGAEEGETGGDIEITGEEIALTVATIDSFGWNGGGAVLIGGDLGGGDPDWAGASPGMVERADHSVVTASQVMVDAGSSIDASALAVGDGGKVIVWSDEGTRFAGTILARGGQTEGNGGFAEVSGHKQLSFNGIVNVGAASGEAGTLLLDPQDITISGDGTWVIDPAALEAALNAGNVFLYTSGALAGQGDIYVNANISYDRNWLMLVAHRNVVIGDGASIVGLDNLDEAYPASLGIMAGANFDPASKKLTGTGEGTLLFAGSGHIDSNSNRVAIVYNPSGGYATPTDFGAHVRLGVGDEPNPYDVIPTWMWVNDAEDLQNISLNLAGQYFLSDIDMSGVTDFVPIGTATEPFTGVLASTYAEIGTLPNAISNLTINSDAPDVGLFGVIGEGGEVSAINMLNATVVATAPDAHVGILAGTSWGYVSTVKVSGSVEATGLSSIAGGVVGLNDGWVGADSAATVSGAGAAGNPVGLNLGDFGGYDGDWIGNYPFNYLRPTRAQKTKPILAAPDFPLAGDMWSPHWGIAGSTPKTMRIGSDPSAIEAFDTVLGWATVCVGKCMGGLGGTALGIAVSQLFEVTGAVPKITSEPTAYRFVKAGVSITITLVGVTAVVAGAPVVATAAGIAGFVFVVAELTIRPIVGSG